MKELYQPIEMEVISFDAENVITTSRDPWEGEEG